MAAGPSAWGLLPRDLGLRLTSSTFPAPLPAAGVVIQRAHSEGTVFPGEGLARPDPRNIPGYTRLTGLVPLEAPSRSGGVSVFPP
jgi:hypothetical protein